MCNCLSVTNTPQKPDEWKNADLKYNAVPSDAISPAIIHEPPKRLLVSSEDIDHFHNPQGRSTGSNDSSAEYTEKRLSESSSQELGILGYEVRRTDDDSSDDSVKTESISLDLEEERLPYDSPHFVQVDMGNGDMATGYNAK